LTQTITKKHLATATRGAAQPIDVGNQKQLFIDHKFIECKETVDLVVNPPEKRPGTFLRSDKPWEAFNLIYFSVAEDQGTCKMWYQAFDDNQWGEGASRMMYATSTDGLNWVKPNLGLVEYEGSRDNNILLDDCKLEYVFIDTNPGAPADQRYKMLSGIGITRMRTSADGIHWKLHDQVVWDFTYDTQKQAWWDERLNKYMIHVRGQVSADTSDPNELSFPFVNVIASNPPVVAPNLYRANRTLARLEVDDIMEPWPVDQARTVMAADEIDPPRSDIYHPGGVYPYPYAADAYFMFPLTYQHFEESETSVGNDGVNDVQFAASRDGIHWMRYDRKSYIPRGLPGAPDCGSTHASWVHIRKGSCLYQYYRGWPWTHGGFRRLSREQQQDRANWGRAHYGIVVQRLDGFVSADAPYTGGWLVTPPIVFNGDHLELNTNVDAMGVARVEIQDEQGCPIPGFSLNECDRIVYNDVAYTVRWRGNADLSALAGRSVRLNVSMRSARLYAFQFCV